MPRRAALADVLGARRPFQGKAWVRARSLRDQERRADPTITKTIATFATVPASIPRQVATPTRLARSTSRCAMKSPIAAPTSGSPARLWLTVSRPQVHAPVQSSYAAKSGGGPAAGSHDMVRI